MTATVFAVLAGVLTALNPCGVALLPVLVSAAGTGDATGRRSTIGHAVVVGLVLSAGGMAGFGTVAIPIALGAQQVANALPWVGLAFGVIMAVLGLLVLGGMRIALLQRNIRVQARSGMGGIFVVGAGYGLASLGCGLPMFLVVIGAALTGGHRFTAASVLAAYVLGMAAVFITVTVGAALVGNQTARVVDLVRPWLRWVNGGLLVAAGAYLAYYWAAMLFASVDARGRDPLITTVERLATRAQQWASTGAAELVMTGAVTVLAAAIVISLWRWARTPPTPRPAASSVAECGCAATNQAAAATTTPAHVVESSSAVDT